MISTYIFYINVRHLGVKIKIFRRFRHKEQRITCLFIIYEINAPALAAHSLLLYAGKNLEQH